jgi:pimeloyl-ACP methyl ester carboxylesterase
MRFSVTPLLVLALALFADTNRCGAQAPSESDVSFKAAVDGSEQRYVQLLYGDYNAEQPRNVLIALHGHGSDRWQFVKDARDECRVARDFARKHGMIFISPDYRARTSWMGPAAEADVVQIIADVRSKHRVDRVFLCGGSMGGTGALTFAAMHPDLIAGVASMNGTANLLEYENFQDAIRESFGGTKAEIPAEYKKRSAEYWPERLTMPVGCTVSGNDQPVPPDSVLRLVKVLQSLNRKVLVVFRKDAGHATSYEDGMTILEFMFSAATTGN